MHNPKQSHWKFGLRMVNYIKGTLGLGEFMFANDIKQLTTYYNSNLTSCVKTRRCITSYFIRFREALISGSQ